MLGQLESFCYTCIYMAQVLLVEDDPFLSTLLKNRLQKEGLEVLLAKTGLEALEILKKSQPDLVLLDLILPEKSGFEVLEDMISNPQYGKPPVIIISNLGQDQDVDRAKQLGVVDYFIKAQTPIDDLVQKIKNYLSTVLKK